MSLPRSVQTSSSPLRRQTSNRSVPRLVLYLYWDVADRGGGAMSGYGQFCPVAKAMELLDERWTMLVVRELLLGSRHFNDLRRGVPKMSPALLSKRLKSLTRAGVVEREEIDGRTTYSLTECGKELADVVEALRHVEVEDHRIGRAPARDGHA